MANYKLLISYDGTRYNGWQTQGNTENTIQEKLTAVLSSVLGTSVEIAGSGRTDAGVHAKGQVASFKTAGFPIDCSASSKGQLKAMCPIPGNIFLTEVNTILPKDIAILSVEEVPESFHARLSARSKTYLYRIHTSEISNVFEHRFMYDYTVPLDIQKMRSAAAFLVGTHDFRAFCGNRHMKKSTIRTITSIDICEFPDEIRISFTGNGFLMNMVRILTGTLIEVGDGRRTPESIPETLNSLDRDKAGYTAPAQGLTLIEVIY